MIKSEIKLPSAADLSWTAIAELKAQISHKMMGAAGCASVSHTA